MADKRFILEDESNAEQQEEEENSWAVPYGNLMTFLMIFFFLLYAFSFWGNKVNYNKIVNKLQKEFTPDKATKEEIEQREKEIAAAEQMQKLAEKMNLDQDVKVDMTAEKIRITLSNPILFTIGQAELKSEAKRVLTQISETLKEIPNPVIIEGHTDNIPITGGKYISNWELSVARAISVINFFTKEQNLPPDRFSTAGYGEYRPVASNDTEDNRGKNRRIEIVIVRTAEKV